MQALTEASQQLDDYFLIIADSFVRNFSKLGKNYNRSIPKITPKITSQEDKLYCTILSLFSQQKEDRVVEMAKLLAFRWLPVSDTAPAPAPAAIAESNLLGFFNVLLRTSPPGIDFHYIYRWAMAKNFLDIVKLTIDDKRADITSDNNSCIQNVITRCTEAKKRLNSQTDCLKSLELEKSKKRAKRVAPDNPAYQDLGLLILKQKELIIQSKAYLKKCNIIVDLLFQRALSSKDNYQNIMHIAKNKDQMMLIQFLLAYEKLLKLDNNATNSALFTEAVKDEVLFNFIYKRRLDGITLLLEDTPEQKYLEKVISLLKICPEPMTDYAAKNYQKILVCSINAHNQEYLQYLCEYMQQIPDKHYAKMFGYFIFAIRLSLNKGDSKTALLLLQQINVADPLQDSDAKPVFLNLIFDLASKKKAVEIINYLSERYKENLNSREKGSIADNKNTLFGRHVATSTGSLPHDPVCERAYYPLS